MSVAGNPSAQSSERDFAQRWEPEGCNGSMFFEVRVREGGVGREMCDELMAKAWVAAGG
jgi:hypothetical protein